MSALENVRAVLAQIEEGKSRNKRRVTYAVTGSEAGPAIAQPFLTPAPESETPDAR